MTNYALLEILLIQEQLQKFANKTIKPKHHSNNSVQKERRRYQYHSFIYLFTAGQHTNPNQLTTKLCQVLYKINSNSGNVKFVNIFIASFVAPW